MRKIAIFVEGMTESIFVDWLLKESLGATYAAIRRHAYADNKLISFAASSSDKLSQLFVLIVDCAGDGSVKSRINENITSMERENYNCIFGLRDLFPIPLTEISAVENALAKGVKPTSISVRMFLAVAETEAWFLQDGTHYERIDAGLSEASPVSLFGFNPVSDSAEARVHPSADLHAVYASVGKAYRKKRSQVVRTVNSLSIEHLFIQLAALIPRLTIFMTALIEESGI